MHWEKVNDDFWADFDELGCVVIEHHISLNEFDKKINIYQAFGITKIGQRLPFPIFESDNFADVDEWLAAYFLKGEKIDSKTLP